MQAIEGNPAMKMNTKFAFTVTHTTALKGTIAPTTMSHVEGEEIPTSRKFVRRNDTFRECQAIHGADADNDAPVLDGLLDTSISKFNRSVFVKKLLHKATHSEAFTCSCVMGCAKAPYKKLMAAINNIDIHAQSLRDIKPDFTVGIPDRDLFCGMYRSIVLYVPPPCLSLYPVRSRA